MLKIRLQGTLRDIQWFRRILEKHKELDSIVFLTIGILGLISIPFEMSADDHNCTSHFGHNCTSHFGVDAFCLALHGADLHIQSGAWSTKHGNCSAWRGCDYYLFPAEWCDFVGYSFFD